MTDEIARLRELVKASGKDQLAFLNLLDRLETAERPDTCDCCGGSGKPVSGKPCICDGYGTAGWERVGLRKAVFDLEEKLEAAERRVAELEKREARWVNVKDRPLPECGALVANVDETGFDMWSWWEGESEGRITCWMENCPTLPDLDRAALRGEEE
jgi:hypothetical protein